MSAYGNLGIIFLGLIENQKAKDSFEKAFAIDLNNKFFWGAYGTLLCRMDEHVRGLKFIEGAYGVIRFSQSTFKIIKQ